MGMAACAAPGSSGFQSPDGGAGAAAAVAVGIPAGPVNHEQVLRGRQLVLSRDCGACHGGKLDPGMEGWLVGAPPDAPGAEPPGGGRVWPRNLTPDDETGLGRVSERQIFNALRYGLRPTVTPDVTITSAVPGQGNHPEDPSYLAPAMPWLWWRYMSDQELWDIAAYLRYGLRPVENHVPPVQTPPDGWASEFTVEKIGTHLVPPFPTAHEELRLPERKDQVLRGRALVAEAACSACHGGGLDPSREGWLTGMTSPDQEFQIGPFKTRPRNLTPDNTTGIGRFSERQLFNALRYGLRPGETADVEITSTVPGEGNHPFHPKYLAPPMPWPAWRHMSDDDLWDIVAYLKHGVKPVANRVADSEGPPDFWAGEYTPDKIGPYPASGFPTANERPVRVASP
ncbi:MAG TPA: c-type cytochrome [Longimicrobiales bacterium]|nr:c-type cytochrome [Longimicrobiales bacterium]